VSTETAILFLDIDDVVCLNRTHGGNDVIEALHGRHADPAEVFTKVFDRCAIDSLERIHHGMQGRLRYVISSTWREFFDRQQLSHVLERGGLGFVATSFHEAWCTPCRSMRGLRVDEVAAWLDRFHRGESFAIVDDMFSGESLKPAVASPLHPFHQRIVLCEEWVGLLPEHVEPLLQALRRPVGA